MCLHLDFLVVFIGVFFSAFVVVVVVSQGVLTLAVHPAKSSLVLRPPPSIGSPNTGGDQTLEVGKA